MCLINGQSVGDQIPDEPMRVPDKADDVKDPSVAESEGEADAAKGCLTTSRGSLLDPEHGALLGPCLWIVPSRRWSCLVARQTLQVPLDLLASCDKGHDCDMLTKRMEWSEQQARATSSTPIQTRSKQTTPTGRTQTSKTITLDRHVNQASELNKIRI